MHACCILKHICLFKQIQYTYVYNYDNNISYDYCNENEIKKSTLETDIWSIYSPSNYYQRVETTAIFRPIISNFVCNVNETISIFACNVNETIIIIDMYQELLMKNVAFIIPKNLMMLVIRSDITCMCILVLNAVYIVESELFLWFDFWLT